MAHLSAESDLVSRCGLQAIYNRYQHLNNIMLIYIDPSEARGESTVLRKIITNTINAIVITKSFPIWAQWITQWGTKLYSSYEWTAYVKDYDRPFSCGFTSDKFGIKARQVAYQDWKPSPYNRRHIRAILIEFFLEDIFVLRGMNAYDRVATLKVILRQAIQEVSVVCEGMCYSVFHKPVSEALQVVQSKRKREE